MSEDREDIRLPDEEGIEAPVDEAKAAPSGKYDKLLGEHSSKFKLSGMFKDWFLDYSSYVILQRAVPHTLRLITPDGKR